VPLHQFPVASLQQVVAGKSPLRPLRSVVSQIPLQRLVGNKLAPSPSIQGSYGETCLMDFGHKRAVCVWSRQVRYAVQCRLYANGDCVQGMDSHRYRRFIEEHKRLHKPPDCPVLVYGIMLHCWAHESVAEMCTVVKFQLYEPYFWLELH